MEDEKQKRYGTDMLLAEFFAQDDLRALAADTGALLECPLLVLDDTFHVTAHHRPLGFSDPLFQEAIRQGQITYEAGAVISQSDALSAGKANYVKLDGSEYRRRRCGRTPAKHSAGNMDYSRTGFGEAGVYRSQQARQAV